MFISVSFIDFKNQNNVSEALVCCASAALLSACCWFVTMSVKLCRHYQTAATRLWEQVPAAEQRLHQDNGYKGAVSILFTC